MNRFKQLAVLLRSGRELQKKGPVFNWTIVPAYIGLIATAVTIYYTSRNIRETEKWKKGEFIANQFEKFNADSNVQFVVSYVDYYSRLVKSSNDQEALLNRDDVAEFLFPVTFSPEIDGQQRAFIRDRFDTYLDKLSLFNRYETAGLIQIEDIKPYLIYQVRLLGEPGKDDHLSTFQESLWGYIERYGYSDVQQLFCKLGYNIYPANKANSCNCAKAGDINQALLSSLQPAPVEDEDSTLLSKAEE